MEEGKEIIAPMDQQPQIPEETPQVDSSGDHPPVSIKDDSQNLFPDSPVYDLEEDENVTSATSEKPEVEVETASKEVNSVSTPLQAKRKLSDNALNGSAKIKKLELADDEFAVSTQTLDNEVSEITNIAVKRKIEDLELPSTTRVKTPNRSSPRRLKRSNSAEITKAKTPKTPKSRPASVDVTRKTPRSTRKLQPEVSSSVKEDIITISSDSSSSRPSVEFVKEVPPPKVPETISEEPASELDDSQGFHLQLSPTTEEDSDAKPKTISNSDPVLVRNREEIIDPDKISDTRSEGYKYSDPGSYSQPKSKEYNIGKTTDQESTDSVCSISLSPEPGPSVASKLISKLSNGNSSTPTEVSDGKHVLVKNREEIIDPGKISDTRSEGYKYSDPGRYSQPKSKEYNIGKTTDQESTDSVCSISLSPEPGPSVASKLISKLSNGNSSTPTEVSDGKHGTDGSDNTPDMLKFNSSKSKKGKNESFRSSNNATPSTISPLPNGHSLPMNTPQIPVFDVHISHNEENEFLSLYVVRTDNDLGMDMCREYQRISKRFTIDPYMADVSVSNSPSSVTSGGMINLPNRTSFASTVSSTSTSSTRTSDGAFVVPQPPRKSITNPTTSVKGYDALMKKLHDIFSHIRESSVDEISDDKVSIGIQTSVSNDSTFSNGNASPEEVNKCDKATPKSSLKKTRVRGRRHIASKTKRALLPTQPEEPENMHGMNSPEMISTNGQSGKESPVKSPKDEKPLSSLIGTPKSVTKLKKKGRPISPRPATPVEKPIVKPEYPGYPPETVVLAKWVDKRYYSGKVLEITEPNKYLIKFDDGQSKVLLDDFIIFGDMKTLPLEGHLVYAMVDEEQTYEPCLVLGVEENKSGTVTYKCTTDGDSLVMVTASELYLIEEQAKSLKESVRTRSPSGPSTPRRRQNRELDLDNIIQGPRSARSRDKGNSSARKRVASPKSPKASTSGLKTKSTPGTGRKRLASESSELSESSNHAPPARLEEVAGVEPEVQRTPRKIDGVKAGPLQLKGAAKHTIGKKNSKLTKFENDEDTVLSLGPIPPADSKLFNGLHFLLTCTESPKKSNAEKKQDKTDAKDKETRHYSSEEDGDGGETTSCVGTDTEDLEFSSRPFNKERLKEQLEAGGGVVYSHFDDVPKNKYNVCKLIAPRPCLTAKYIQCLAADIRSLSHDWVIMSCIDNALCDMDSFALPAGWSIIKQRFINWVGPSGRRNASFFKDKTILVCGEQEFVKFWERVATLAGANTRVVNEEDINTNGALVLVTEWDCPHQVQNKANADSVPLVSTTWLVQCLVEARALPPSQHDRFSFMYSEPE